MANTPLELIMSGLIQPPADNVVDQQATLSDLLRQMEELNQTSSLELPEPVETNPGHPLRQIALGLADAFKNRAAARAPFGRIGQGTALDEFIRSRRDEAARATSANEREFAIKAANERESRQNRRATLRDEIANRRTDQRVIAAEEAQIRAENRQAERSETASQKETRTRILTSAAREGVSIPDAENMTMEELVESYAKGVREREADAEKKLTRGEKQFLAERRSERDDAAASIMSPLLDENAIRKSTDAELKGAAKRMERQLTILYAGDKEGRALAMARWYEAIQPLIDEELERRTPKPKPLGTDTSGFFTDNRRSASQPQGGSLFGAGGIAGMLEQAAKMSETIRRSNPGK